MILRAATPGTDWLDDPILFTLGCGGCRATRSGRALYAAGDFFRVSAIYFSFVTLAALGPGDIVPRTEIARGIAIVEGAGGQLFLAVLIARLVSLYTRGKVA